MGSSAAQLITVNYLYNYKYTFLFSEDKNLFLFFIYHIIIQTSTTAAIALHNTYIPTQHKGNKQNRQTILLQYIKTKQKKNH